MGDGLIDEDRRVEREGRDAASDLFDLRRFVKARVLRIEAKLVERDVDNFEMATGRDG